MRAAARMLAPESLAHQPMTAASPGDVRHHSPKVSFLESSPHTSTAGFSRQLCLVDGRGGGWLEMGIEGATGKSIGAFAKQGGCPQTEGNFSTTFRVLQAQFRNDNAGKTPFALGY